MNLKIAKYIFFNSILLLMMSTSCIHRGPFHAIAQPIECPPVEYDFPLYLKSDEVKLQQADFSDKSSCPSTHKYTLTTKKEEYALLNVKIIRENNKCKLITSFDTLKADANVNQEQVNSFINRNENYSKNFYRYLGFSKTGEHELIIGTSNNDTIQKWCESNEH